MNIGVEKRPRIRDSRFYVPPNNASIQEMNVTSNFDGNRIAVADTKDGANGEVYVYDYTITTNTWSTPVVITCPISGATNYGSSISMNWDGTRVVVGASAISTVYVYDLVTETGVVNTTSVITGTSGTDFGFSVSLAANIDDILCVGAPLGSAVFVYELDGGTWTQTFTDSGTTIKNRLPLTPTSNVVLKNHLSRYGFHVSISPNGRHIAAGAPGFVEYRTGSGTELDPYRYDLTTTHIETIETAPGETVQQPPYKLGATYYKFLGNLMRQLGNVRVFSKGGNPSWSSGVAKIGNDIEGDPDNVLLTTLSVGGDYRIRPTFPDDDDYSIISGWSFPALGMCTHVADDLTVTASSPLTPTDTDRGLCTGKVNTFRLVGSAWQEYGSAIPSPFNTMEFGKSFSVDYNGTRIATTGSNSELFGDDGARVVSSIITVHDWNGTEWYESQPVMVLVENSYVSGSGFSTFDRLSVSINSGEHIFCVSAKYYVVVTKNAPLTQLFQGNSLFSGYVSTSDLFVGINNADDLNTSSKKISFGGTFRDQAYDLTTIENRSMLPQANGRSELLLAKKTGNGGGIDFIRIKANEIHMDTFRFAGISYRNPNETVYGTESLLSYSDTKTIHSPVMVINTRGCVCINHPIRPSLLALDTSNRYTGSIESKAFLDVNGDTYIRNKTTVNYTGRSELKGGDRSEPVIFYDTRDPTITYTENGTIRARSKTQPYQSGLSDTYGLLTGDVAYSDALKSFEFGSVGTGKIQNFLGGTLDHEPLRFSMWLMLKNAHSTYTESNCFSISSIESFRYKQTLCTFQIVSSGFKVLYRDLKNASNTFSFSTSTTIPANTWTHLEVRLPAGRENTPSPVTSVAEIEASDTSRKSAVAVWINSVIQSSPWTTVGIPNVNFLGFNRVELVLGGNLMDAYMGQFMAWVVYAYVGGIATVIGYTYNNGPPTEMLAVGGDAIIQRRLAIGSTNPTEALEVTGNVVVSGSMTATSFSFTGGLDATNITGVLPVLHGGTGVTESTGTGKVVLSVSPTLTGSVGINTTTNPTEALEVTGNTVVSGSLDVGSVLYLTGGLVPSGVDPIVDTANKSNTYIIFREAGADNDWAYLRQIGGSNEYHMALDFHDDGSDARFSIRDVQSTANPDVITTRFTVKSGGNVGMGVPDPLYALDVSGDINFTGDLRKNGAIVSSGGLDPIVSLGPWIDDASELALHHSSLDGFTNYALRQDDNGGTHVNANFAGLLLEYGGVERMRVHSNGNVGVNNTGPVYTLDVGGTIRASGDVIAFSDGRYKTDVQRIDGALEKVGRVSGYTFRMKDGTERRAGVIAQEIREVLPEVVVGDEEAGYNVAYGNMAGLFIEAIKELKARVETLEAALRSTRPEGLSPE